MDPLIKIWMFENWMADLNETSELAKNHAYLVGSFTNPEAVKKILGEDGNSNKLSEEEFEASTKLMLEDANKQASQSIKKKKRKLKK